MDSYDKALITCQELAIRKWDSEEKFFERVHKDDIQEIKAELLFKYYEEEEYQNNERIYPLHMKKEFDRTNSCCGSGQHLIKCSSGRKYLYGYNYGH
jgi:hypothetical protein